jgi:hypothetical protein
MRRRSTPTLLAWSVIGMLAGHHATYLAIYRDPTIVADVLAATGHGWLWIAPILVFSAALIALVLGVMGADPIQSFRWRFASLAGIQVGAFVVIEIAERNAAGVDLWASLLGADDRILLLGGLIQVAVALLLAMASRVVERIAHAIRQVRSARPRRRPGLTLRPAFLPLPLTAAPSRANAPRAPPIRR